MQKNTSTQMPNLLVREEDGKLAFLDVLLDRF